MVLVISGTSTDMSESLERPVFYFQLATKACTDLCGRSGRDLRHLLPANPGIAVRSDEVSFSTANKATNVRVVSKKEFWDIEGTNATRITLTWNSNSDIGALTDNSLNLLTIAGWNPRTQSWEKSLVR